MIVRKFEFCKLVKGAIYGLVIDTQRSTYIRAPVDFIEFILSIDQKQLFEIKKNLSEKEKEYFDYALKEEIIFCSDKNVFHVAGQKDRIKMSFNHVVFEISSQSTYYTQAFKLLTTEMTLESMQVVFLDNCTDNAITNFFKVSDSYPFRSVQVLMPYNLYDESFLIGNAANISHLILYKAPSNYVTRNAKRPFAKIVSITNQNPMICCGSVSEKEFIINKTFYKESKNYNNCLLGKLSFDSKGNIRHCPNSKKKFGNISNTNYSELLNTNEFTKLWKTTKDSVSVCKDCEYRYICRDCRAFTETSNDKKKLSKPLKCGYNPYNGEWSEWSSNPLKQNAIDFYGIREAIEQI